MNNKIENKDEIKELTDYIHIRNRLEMYLGSKDNHTQQLVEFDKENPDIEEITWTPALYTGFREIIDNSSDEVIGHGHGNKIDIIYDEENLIFGVKDNGRGIPFDYNEEKNEYTATMVLSRPRTGRNFGERGNVAGTNGIGSKATSNTAEWFEVDIVRDNQNFIQKFEENLTGDELTIKDPLILPSSEKSRTSIKYSPSKEVYHTRTLPFGFVKSRITEFAAINPEITISFNGNVIKNKKTIEKTLFPNNKTFTIDVYDEETQFNSKFIIIPNFTKGDEHYQSIVNNILAFEGGTHMDAFRINFPKEIINALQKESKRRKLTPNKTDIMENLLVFNVTKMIAPNFGSQSKTRLTTEYAGKLVAKTLTDKSIMENIIKSNKDWVEEIYNRCEERTHKKDASDLNKLTKKIAKAKVPSLMDAVGKDRSKCILFITEGESAKGGILSVREPEIHGAIALRGKILNVSGETPKKVLENKILQDIMNSMGLVIGKKATFDTLRYGKIYIATDEDQDGKNIRALLVNFFYTFWPELFDEDQEIINIFMTPFIIAEKGKKRYYWYSYNYDEFNADEWKGSTITRAKGLGTLIEDDWSYSLKNPMTQKITDDGNLKEALSLIFDKNRADDRKEWMGV